MLHNIASFRRCINYCSFIWGGQSQKNVSLHIFFILYRFRGHLKNSCFGFHQGFQTPRNNKSTRPAASSFHLFLGVWNPWWNPRTCFWYITWSSSVKPTYTGINECSCICKMLYWSHKLLKLLFFRNDYTFIITTNILTLMKIYFLAMKGKRCIKKKKKKKRKRVGIQWFTPSSRTSERNKFSFIHKETKKKMKWIIVKNSRILMFLLISTWSFWTRPWISRGVTVCFNNECS